MHILILFYVLFFFLFPLQLFYFLSCLFLFAFILVFFSQDLCLLFIHISFHFPFIVRPSLFPSFLYYSPFLSLPTPVCILLSATIARWVTPHWSQTILKDSQGGRITFHIFGYALTSPKRGNRDKLIKDSGFFFFFDRTDTQSNSRPHLRKDWTRCPQTGGLIECFTCVVVLETIFFLT